jgi:GTP-binding protein
MIDKAEITVKAGDGGDGAVSFRREKFVPFGGPDGGDGGDGGRVIVRSSADVDDLRPYRHKRLFKAANGAGGSGRKRHGKSGADLVLEVPAGTIVTAKDAEGNESLLADLGRPGEEIVVAEGGRGGRANVHYASSTNQAPHVAQHGEPGGEATIGLEMRLIADVGIIGYPNAGKSTLLAAASAARPKIAGYPFTTLEPVLGVVEVGTGSFVMAEIPGLIEGAHAGRGLGHDFLRHAMRTRIFVHIIAGDTADPVDDMLRVNRELHEFDPELATRPQAVAVNKVDLTEVQERLPELRKVMRGAGVHAHFISAAAGDGVPALMDEVRERLRELQVEEASPEEIKLFKPEPRQERYSVLREEGGYVVSAPELERLYAAPGSGTGELRRQVTFQLQRMGAVKDLERAGIKKGDTVRCGEVSWTW